MATNVTLNGTTYAIPGLAESGWGDEVSNYLIALASGTLQKAGGAFTLTAEVDFGATYGIKAAYFKSRGTVSSTGILRLANTETIAWRDYTNSADIALTTSASDRLTYGGVNVPTISSTDTLTNKTFDVDGAGNSLTNIANANIKAGAGIAINKLAALTASRALETDGSGVISPSSVTSTELGYLSGVTSAVQTQINTNASNITTNSGNINTNASNITTNSGNISTLDAAAAKTADNETISGTWDFDNPLTMAHNSTPTNPAASHNKLYFKSDDKLYKLDSSGNELEVGSGAGSGAGSGEINFISNSDFESGTIDYGTYADAAGTSPVDGTGGSANITISSQDTVVLRGNKSLKIAKDGANRQGEGVSIAFSTGLADPPRKTKIEFSYKTDEDAGYEAGDLKVYVYDVDNSTLITPRDTDIPRGADIFQTSFDTTTSTSYRLIFHVADSDSSAWDAYIDNVIVGPGSTSQGAAVGGFASYSGSFTNLSTSQTTFQYRRVGENIEVYATGYVNGAASGTITIDLPAGVTLDTAKIKTSSSASYLQGTAFAYDVSNAALSRHGVPMAESSTSVSVRMTNNGAKWQNTLPFTWASGDEISIRFTAPVVEWAGKGIVPMLAEDNLSEWQSFTLSLGSFSINNSNSYYRRVGEDMEVRFSAVHNGAGSGANVSLNINTIFGLTVDNSKIVEQGVPVVGSAHARLAGVTDSLSAVSINTTLPNQVLFYETSSITANFLDGSQFANGDLLAATFRIPIAEWAGSQNSLVGYSQADGTNTGLLPPVTSMSAALATQLGHKQYTSEVITGTNSWATTRAVLIPYQMQDGTWRLKFNISGTSLLSTTVILTFPTTTTFYNGTDQAGCVYPDGGSGRLRIISNTSTALLVCESATTGWKASGDVELASKPTWAS